MSAATSAALDKTPQRVFPRHPIHVPLDLIALRSGVPENLPGRCTDISEAGVGAVVAGELTAGQQVAVELRLPDVGVPVRARALVRYQSRLRYGLEFSGLSAEQREMIRYWVYRAESADEEVRVPVGRLGASETVPQEDARPTRNVLAGRRGLFLFLIALLASAILGWWEWDRSWKELESQSSRESNLRVPAETMDQRIVTKVDPIYPESARAAGTEGIVVLDATIASDGTVKHLQTVSGPELLAKSAMEAVQLWKFEPYLSSGKPVEVQTTIAVQFRLN